MRTKLFTAALLSLLVVLASVWARRPAAVPSGAELERPELAQLEAHSGLADAAALHTIGEFFTGGTIVETPRRLGGARLQMAAGFLLEPPADEPARAAQLRLRESARARREIGDILERDAAGASSFHTATPPPSTLA
jgi:hypothetical protein